MHNRSAARAVPRCRRYGGTRPPGSLPTARTPHSLGTVGFTVPDAHLLALHAHEGQVDKQGRDYYLAHLRPIAEALRPYGPHAEMAGALHDIVEDTRDHPDPARRYDLDRLRVLGVPEVVVEAIDAVTRRPGEPYISGLIRRSAAHPLGRLVKLADNAHNLATNAELAEVDPDKARSLREGRYRPARRILLAAEAADRGHGRRILV
jgi:(p)ppGpp synthase/HD superfamily hydrolase